MALSASDLASMGYKVAVATGNAVLTGSYRIMGMSTVATDTATLTINDALTTGGGGTTLYFSAPANQSRTKMFTPNGIRFGTGMSVEVTGTTPHPEVYYIQE